MHFVVNLWLMAPLMGVTWAVAVDQKLDFYYQPQLATHRRLRMIGTNGKLETAMDTISSSRPETYKKMTNSFVYVSPNTPITVPGHQDTRVTNNDELLVNDNMLDAVTDSLYTTSNRVIKDNVDMETESISMTTQLFTASTVETMLETMASAKTTNAMIPITTASTKMTTTESVTQPILETVKEFLDSTSTKNINDMSSTIETIVINPVKSIDLTTKPFASDLDDVHSDITPTVETSFSTASTSKMTTETVTKPSAPLSITPMLSTISPTPDFMVSTIENESKETEFTVPLPTTVSDESTTDVMNMSDPVMLVKEHSLNESPPLMSPSSLFTTISNDIPTDFANKAATTNLPRSFATSDDDSGSTNTIIADMIKTIVAAKAANVRVTTAANMMSTSPMILGDIEMTTLRPMIELSTSTEIQQTATTTNIDKANMNVKNTMTMPAVNPTNEMLVDSTVVKENALEMVSISTLETSASTMTTKLPLPQPSTQMPRESIIGDIEMTTLRPMIELSTSTEIPQTATTTNIDKANMNVKNTITMPAMDPTNEMLVDSTVVKENALDMVSTSTLETSASTMTTKIPLPQPSTKMPTENTMTSIASTSITTNTHSVNSLDINNEVMLSDEASEMIQTTIDAINPTKSIMMNSMNDKEMDPLPKSLPPIMSSTMPKDPSAMTSMSSIMNRPPVSPGDNDQIVAMDDHEADTVASTMMTATSTSAQNRMTRKSQKGDASCVRTSGILLTVSLCVVARMLV